MIIELVSAPNMPDNLQALATGGRITVIGVSAGATTELNLLALMGKRARIHGSTLRARWRLPTLQWILLPNAQKEAARRARDRKKSF